MEQVESKERARIDASDQSDGAARVLRGRHWLSRIVFLRCLGFVYLVAFLVALESNSALLGDNGLLPATRFMDRIQRHLESLTPFEKVFKLPTIFWFVSPTANNLWWAAAVGAAVSAAIAVRGAANVLAMTLLWALYHSIVNVGQTWYAYGWESQLLETGFLAMFLVPCWSLSQFPHQSPTPRVCVWGYRWLLFRVMLGAGLIKMRGDRCWQDLTCMEYHYQTQPNPNPLSPYLHHVPGADWHKVEVIANHIVELILPWGLLLGRRARAISGAAQILFQAVLIMSGNLSFLNWLTIVPAVFAFDDGHLASLFSARVRRRHAYLYAPPKSQEDARRARERSLFDAISDSRGVQLLMRSPRWIANVSLAILVFVGSAPVVKNMAGMGGGQVMNTSFSSLRIVNTYGNFGSVTKARGEVVLKGTRDSDPADANARWEEYEFKCKPGDVDRRPCVITPFHLRLDWQMWFAAFQNYGTNPWLVHLAYKLLSCDDETRVLAASLLRVDPFASPGETATSEEDPVGTTMEVSEAAGASNTMDGVSGDGVCEGPGTRPAREQDKLGTDGHEAAGGGGPPLFIKADLYLYEFTRPTSLFLMAASGEGAKDTAAARQAGMPSIDPSSATVEVGRVWTRRLVREYMPPVSLENPSVLNFLRSHGLM